MDYRRKESTDAAIKKLNAYAKSTILSKEVFLERANKKHNFKYNYSKIEYVNTTTKICIVCNDHGEFYQSPNGHLNGNGCNICGHIAQASKIRITPDEFLLRANKIHNYKYTYLIDDNLKSRNKIKIKCEDHGEFLQRVSNHIRGAGCRKCSKQISNNTSKPEKLWLDSLNILERNITIKINNKWYYVDGLKDNIIYEFYGDYWHGNPEKYNPADLNTRTNKTFGELYDNTTLRENIFKSAGYELVTIWESHFHLGM